MDLVRKIHEKSDDTCFAGILTKWSNTNMENMKLAEELFDLISNNISIQDASIQLNISNEYAEDLINEYMYRYDVKYIDCMYDRLFPMSDFLKQCDELKGEKDIYFTLNSFYRLRKKSEDVRHINAFVLDFDYYKIKKYQEMNAYEFYRKKIKKKLDFEPTAVVDSGRGLYVIYAFDNCSYHMENLYKSIMKHYIKKFKNYGADPKATNITQVIRLPGSINGRVNKEVKVLEIRDTQYKIQDFATLLPYTKKEVKEFSIEKVKKKRKRKKIDPSKLDLSKRKPYFNDFYEDLKKLILLRNKNQVKGYREELLFILREKACWSGYTIAESIELAKELNKVFRRPLSDVEVEERCRPSGNRMPCSYEKIIEKLDISIDEQLHMKVLRNQALKKSSYAKKKRKHPLLNRTEKEQSVLERRTRVCELKNKEHLSNSEIAKVLEVNKSTITRDLKYIQSNPAQFIQKLKSYMDEMHEFIKTEYFAKKTLYERQKQLLKWLEIGNTALDFLVRELGVAEI